MLSSVLSTDNGGGSTTRVGHREGISKTLAIGGNRSSVGGGLEELVEQSTTDGVIVGVGSGDLEGVKVQSELADVVLALAHFEVAVAGGGAAHAKVGGVLGSLGGAAQAD